MDPQQPQGGYPPQQYIAPGTAGPGSPGTYGANPPPPGTHQVKYVFTPDELRALRECNRESFYYRCLPIGTFLSGATYFAIKAGYLKGSARWGPSPKMFLAATLGYIIGKFSYQKNCVEKILALPNSPLAEMIRKNKQGGGSGMGFSETLSLEPNFTSVTGSTYTGDNEPRTLDSNLFTDVGDQRPMESFDNNSSTPGYYSRSYENEQQMESTVPPASPQYVTSYEELRRQNREEYERRIHAPPAQFDQRRPPTTNVIGIQQHDHQVPPQQQQQVPIIPPGKKNKYGDSWE